jgi:hypothetical protein
MSGIKTYLEQERGGEIESERVKGGLRLQRGDVKR